jgi:hypothetical protein
MDEAERVLGRLGRIGELEQACAPAAALLDELRALAAEARSWALAEGDARARAAAARFAAELDRRGAAGPRAPLRRA